MTRPASPRAGSSASIPIPQTPSTCRPWPAFRPAASSQPGPPTARTAAPTASMPSATTRPEPRWAPSSRSTAQPATSRPSPMWQLSATAVLSSCGAPTSRTAPEELLIARENLEILEQKIEKELSSFERQVLDLHLTGMSYIQIAKVLGKDEKSTDNALQRIKGKLKAIKEVEHIDSNYKA